jgi:hypothetical protein
MKNLPAMPSGKYPSAMTLPDGTGVVVTIDWDHVAYLARRAQGNKGRSSSAGPITVKVPKP